MLVKIYPRKCIFSRLCASTRTHLALSNYKKTSKGEAFSKRNSSKYIQYIGTQDCEQHPKIKATTNTTIPGTLNCSRVHTVKILFPSHTFSQDTHASVCWFDDTTKKGTFWCCLCVWYTIAQVFTNSHTI